MERVYNKLVRDKIPAIIEGNGETPITKILNETEYKEELEKNYMRSIKKLLRLTVMKDSKN